MIAKGSNGLKAYVGSTGVDKMYLGDTLVYSSIPLPYDAQVEYLESTGEQYIDTGIKYDSNNSYEIICGMTAMASAGTNNYLNGWDAGGAFGVMRGKMTNGDGSSFGVNIVGIYVIMDLLINSGTSTKSVLTVDVNGTSYNRSRAHGSLSNYAKDKGYHLFACFSNTTVKYHISEQIAYCKIFQNGSLVRDFIPVRKNGVGYLYDKVSGELFGNAGTGSFVLGADVV